MIIGTITENSNRLAIRDTRIGIMAWMNLIAIIILSPKAFRTLKEKIEGLDPKKFGIKDPEC